MSVTANDHLEVSRLVLELGTMARFPTAGSLPRYLGLTPSEYSSGPVVRRGHILKCGPGALRALLLQCAWAAVRKAPDPQLSAVFERLAPRVGRKRAIIAVARRLAGTEKAQRLLGFRAQVGLDEGLRRLVHWWWAAKPQAVTA